MRTKAERLTWPSPMFSARHARSVPGILILLTLRVSLKSSWPTGLQPLLQYEGKRGLSVHVCTFKPAPAFFSAHLLTEYSEAPFPCMN